MHCPTCGNTTSIHFDLHSDGYADNIFECSSCDTMWISEFNEITLLNNKVA